MQLPAIAREGAAAFIKLQCNLKRKRNEPCNSIYP
jgi:hypothetical protein